VPEQLRAGRVGEPPLPLLWRPAALADQEQPDVRVVERPENVGGPGDVQTRAQPRRSNSRSAASRIPWRVAAACETSQLRTQLHGMWASVAPAWAEHADYADTRGETITAKLLQLTAPRPGERVLELACGAGGVGIAAARLVGPAGEVVLSDVAAEMTAIAAARAAAAGLGNVRTLTLDLDDPERLARLLGDAGLAEVVVTEVPTPLRDASVQAWWTRTSSLAGPLARRLAALPDPARHQLQARLEAAAHPYRTPAGLDFPGVSLLGAGRLA
jgi:hypothetical protein